MYKLILLLTSSILLTACGEQPSTVIEQKPSTVIEQKPSTVTEQKPSTVTEQKPSTVTEQHKTATQCVELRNEWQRLALNGMSEADQYLSEYKNGGCLKTCGRLVEDTDTVEKETWCN